MTFFIIDKFVDVKLIGYGLLTFSLAAFIISLYKKCHENYCIYEFI